MTLTVLNVAYPFAPVAPDTAGGAEQILGRLDQALTAAGHHSIVIACKGSKVAGTLLEVPDHPDEIDADTRHMTHAAHREAIAFALRRYPVDVIHMHGIDFDAYLPPAGPPVLATLHLPVAWYSSAALHPQRPDTWLNCVSASQHRSLAANDKILSPIENGVDVEGFGGPWRRRQFAVMLTRICPEKGVHLALDAAKRAGVPLLIAGELFPYPDHRRYFWQEIWPRLDGERRCIGRIGPRAKRHLLTAARCLLVPSLAAETSSLAAREAAAAGTPCIAYARGALPETIEHGRTGFLVEDLEGMIAAIRQVDRISPDDCRAVARRRFSATRMASRYLGLYRRLAHRAAVPPAKAS